MGGWVGVCGGRRGGGGEAVVCTVFFPVQQKLWAAELTAASALLSIFSHFKPRERTKAGS